MNSLTFISGDANQLPSVANKVCRVGATSAGSVASPGFGVYEFSRGQDGTIPDSVGYGEVVEETAQALRLTGADCVLLKVTTDIAGTISAVTEDPAGSGPTMTITGTPTMDLARLAVKVTRAGVLGAAAVSVAFDGYTYVVNYDVPAETGAVVNGSVDLTGLTLSSLNTLTLIFNPGGGDQTVTFTTPSNVADIATQINTQTTLCVASIVGGRYLRIVTDAVGGSATLTVNATSTSEIILGLDTDAHTGSASSIALTGTGLTLGFPSGTYVLSTIYYAAIVGARFSVSAMETALDALKTAAVEVGVVEVCQTPLDGTEAVSFFSSMSSKLSSWRSSDEPWYVKGVVRSPLGSTGTSGISTNDLAVKAAFLGQTDTIGAVTVVHGDIYTSGTFVKGSHRRALATPLSIRAAGYSLSEDPGSGEMPSLPECSIVGPDGTTRARNENTATTKMRTSGFTVLEGRKKLPYFARGVTRAPSSSKFVHFGVVRMALFGGRLAWDAMLEKVNITRDLTKTGKLQTTDRKELEAFYRERLETPLLKGPDKHASAVETSIPDVVVATTTRYSLTWTVQHRAQIEAWDADLIVTGVLVVGDGASQTIS